MPSDYYIMRRYRIAVDNRNKHGKDISIIYDPAGEYNDVFCVNGTTFFLSLYYGYWTEGMIVVWLGQPYYVAYYNGLGYLLGERTVHLACKSGDVGYSREANEGKHGFAFRLSKTHDYRFAKIEERAHEAR